MTDLFLVAHLLTKFFREQGWPFCFIGGLALQRWGENRLTRDVDVSLFVGFGGEEQFIDTILQTYTGRRDDAARFAQDYRVLLVQDPGGTPIDISLAALPFEEDSINRATEFEIIQGQVHIPTCSAEDLIVMKAFADRPQDWVDIIGIIKRQGESLERAAVIERLIPLAALKEDSTIVDRLEVML